MTIGKKKKKYKMIWRMVKTEVLKVIEKEE